MTKVKELTQAQLEAIYLAPGPLDAEGLALWMAVEQELAERDKEEG